MKVVGKTDLRSGEFEGRKWAHRKLYVVHPDGQINGLEGEVAEALKIPENVSTLSDVSIGRNIDVEFNRYGKVSAIRLVP